MPSGDQTNPRRADRASHRSSRDPVRDATERPIRPADRCGPIAGAAHRQSRPCRPQDAPCDRPQGPALARKESEIARRPAHRRGSARGPDSPQTLPLCGGGMCTVPRQASTQARGGRKSFRTHSASSSMPLWPSNGCATGRSTLALDPGRSQPAKSPHSNAQPPVRAVHNGRTRGSTSGRPARVGDGLRSQSHRAGARSTCVISTGYPSSSRCSRSRALEFHPIRDEAINPTDTCCSLTTASPDRCLASSSALVFAACWDLAAPVALPSLLS